MLGVLVIGVEAPPTPDILNSDPGNAMAKTRFGATAIRNTGANLRTRGAAPPPADVQGMIEACVYWGGTVRCA